MNSIPETNSESVILSSANHCALFLTQLGIVTSGSFSGDSTPIPSIIDILFDVIILDFIRNSIAVTNSLSDMFPLDQNSERSFIQLGTEISDSALTT